MVGKLDSKNANIIAKIHSRSLSGDFLPSLGPNFLTCLYKGILEEKLAFGFVEKENKSIKGFILATTDMKRLLKTVFIKKFASLFISILPTFFKHPSIIFKIIETVTYSDKESKTKIKSELIVIAVDEKFRNQNIGSNLCLTLDKEFAKLGIKEYKVTVNSVNINAIRFYRNRGFKLTYNFSLYNKDWSLLTKKI